MTASEPACWSWQPPLGTADEYRAELLASGLSASAVARIVAVWDGGFHAFHEGRCAICGIADPDLVEDHDHETGMIRGLLCRSCNTKEGVGDSQLLANYRRRNPASILGVQIPYTGYGWVDGRRIGAPLSPVPYDPVKDNPLRNVGL